METKNEVVVREDLPTWEKPQIKELDINAITLSGSTGSGVDNVIYS